MVVKKSKRAYPLVITALVMAACNPKSDGDPKTNQAAGSQTGTTTGTGTGTGSAQKGENDVSVAGQLALALGLHEGHSHVTHVVAQDTDSNEARIAEVSEDGTFELAVEKEKNWVLTYVDATKSGAEMLVSTFKADTLDTVVPGADSKDIELGTIDASKAQATSTTSTTDLLATIGMSSGAAETYGAIDDVSLRYSNPDIDADGRLDAEVGQKFPLDFHNRFNVKKANGTDLAMKDIKNKFPPDDAQVVFGGSGVIPWFDEKEYAEKPDAYSWSFSSDVQMSYNGGQACEGIADGTILLAGNECKKKLSAGGLSVSARPSIELKAAVAGTYTLKAGGKTFTWTNVKVSDFSGGEGFIALFLRMDVDDQDKLSGVSYRWRRKASDGSWAATSEEELKLLVAGGGGYVSFKVDGMNSGKELGVRLPLKPDGSIAFATAKFQTDGNGEQDDADVMLGSSGITETEVKDGIAWTRVLENPGISYDDKLGMRFFMGFVGSNN